MGVVVIGVGNPWRGDDGVGWAVIDRVEGALAGQAELVHATGEATELVEAWSGADLAVVVDAVRSGATAGTVHRDVGFDALTPTGPVSSHGLGVIEAVELGRVLGRLPGRLALFGIEGRTYELGRALSGAVAAAVVQVVDQVVATVEGRLAPGRCCAGQASALRTGPEGAR